MHCGKEYGAFSMQFLRLAHAMPILLGSTAPSLDILLIAINLIDHAFMDMMELLLCLYCSTVASPIIIKCILLLYRPAILHASFLKGQGHNHKKGKAFST